MAVPSVEPFHFRPTERRDIPEGCGMFPEARNDGKILRTPPFRHCGTFSGHPAPVQKPVFHLAQIAIYAVI
jgi:hypothetical protein